MSFGTCKVRELYHIIAMSVSVTISVTIITKIYRLLMENDRASFERYFNRKDSKRAHPKSFFKKRKCKILF